jgi:hypothetical protein
MLRAQPLTAAVGVGLKLARQRLYEIASGSPSSRRERGGMMRILARSTSDLGKRSYQMPGVMLAKWEARSFAMSLGWPPSLTSCLASAKSMLAAHVEQAPR